MILEADENFPQPGIIEHAVETINKNSGIFVYPTDTIYGLGCKINDKVALEKLNKLKKRSSSKNYSILFKDIEQLYEYVNINKKQKIFLNKYLPGSFTFVLKANNKVPKYLVSKGGFVGIRVIKNKIANKLIAILKSPIITTSFNVSREKNIKNINLIPKKLLNQVSVVLNVGILKNKPSTVIDLTNNKPIILRKGLEKL